MTFSLFFLLWAPVLGWAALIFYLSSIPSLNSGLGIWDTFLRKGAHIFEFAVLTGLLLRALRRTCATIAQKNLLLTAGGLSLIYAISDEYHQSFVPGRGPSIIDVLIDAIGITSVLWFYSSSRRKPGSRF